METSDVIATVALVLSLMALFVSFTTKFSEFATASWGNIGLFVVGFSFLLLGLFSLWAFLFSPIPPDETMGRVVIVWGSSIGALIMGSVLVVIAVRRERKKKD
jgi:amino acid transporter